jgi:hypothetical protein
MVIFILHQTPLAIVACTQLLMLGHVQFKVSYDATTEHVSPWSCAHVMEGHQGE